jgi:hypothetical protein
MLIHYIKVATALVIGKSFESLITNFPRSVVGVLFAFSGLELAMCANPASVERDGGRSAMLVMLGTAGAGLAMGSGVAFLVGVAMHLTLRAARWCQLRSWSTATAGTSFGS